MPIDGAATERTRELVALGTDLAAFGVSWVPLVGGPVATLLQGVTNREFRRRIHLLEQIINDLGGRFDVLEKLMASDEGDAELMEDAIHYADHCRSEDGLRLMGRIVVFGVSTGDEGNLGKAHLLLDAVGRLQPEHLTLIREFATARNLNEKAGFWQPGQRERARQTLVEYLPELADLIDPLLGGLEAAGLIRRLDPEQQTVTRFSNRRDVQWILTTFGVEVAQYLGPGGTSPTAADRTVPR